MAGLLTLISNAFGAVKEAFGYARNRSDLKNKDDVRERAKKQDEVAADSKTVENIQNRDADEIRKQASE